MDEYDLETCRFQVLGYDIEVKDILIAEALKNLTEKKLWRQIRMGKKERQIDESELLPFHIIQAASEGDVEAINVVHLDN